VTDPAGAVARWTYDGDGNVLTTTSPNNTVASNVYDAAGNITSSTVPLNGTQNALTGFAYADTAHPGDITTITDPSGNPPC